MTSGSKVNKLGNKAYTIGKLKDLDKVFKQLQRDKKQLNSSVELFMLSPACRGLGMRRKLMDYFISYCDKAGAQSIFLYTDRSCSYEFYDKYYI